MWLDGAPLVPGRSYLPSLGTQQVGTMVAAPDHAVDVNTQKQMAAPTLGLNDIGVADLRLDRSAVFTPFGEGPDLGGFVLIDRDPLRAPQRP